MISYMRLAIYNHMFALNGNSFWQTVIGHWAVHYQADPGRIWSRADIDKTVETIKKSNADIIGVVEVLEGQEEELKKKLKKIGYKYFYMANGHKTKYSKLHVQEMIASKIKGKQQDTGEWPVEHRLGGGGGFAHVYYFGQGFNVILAHFGLPSKKYYWKQMSFLQGYLKKLNGKVVILGDFNLPYQSFKSCVDGFNLVSGEVKSCSRTPILKWFYNKDVDHILVRGYKGVKNGVLDGVSDHKLVYSDIN